LVKVLVIEDDPSLRLLWRVGLEVHGMRVIEACDGVTGLELARREQPDVITLDVMLPWIDGWGVARRLREDSATRDIPIVFLTARAGPDDRQRGLELGAVNYITVPINPTELPQAIEAVLERRSS
jgi:two-component system, OmpR family, alkaline phosphatase synthesis response regulator PhoP